MLESGWSTGSSSSCWNAMAAWAWRSEARVTLVPVFDRLVLTPGSTGKAPGRAVASPVDSPPMTNLDEQGRPEPPLAADETATLLGFLEYQRATLAWKCGGLDAAGLRATVAASSMTLGGLLKHLAYVEDLWCSRWLHGRDRQPPWDKVDWKADGGLERLARRPGTQPAMDPVPHDRGVRAAQRPCRPPPRVGGRAHRGVAAGRTAPS